MSLFSHCHSLPAFQHPIWYSSWPFFILKQKSQVLKFTGLEVFAENLLNRLGPGISSVSSAEGKAGRTACCLPGAAKQRETNNGAVEIPARSWCVDGAHQYFCLFVRLFLGNAGKGT